MEAGLSARQVARQLGCSDGVGPSRSERCHLHADQAQDTLDRPVVEKTATLQEMHAYSQLLHQSPSRFSDEPRFILSSDDNRVRVWRPRSERLNPAFALQRHTAPTAGASFQQDCALPHTARVSQDCLRTDTTLPWPAPSPDLSPIEHIWDYLEH
ncbi:uncharacterized protein TNCV_2602231 [Trichonephila clavipes]|nr:uncharacterized protein TNCV_2602231 [Trichonephila clavipes]